MNIINNIFIKWLNIEDRYLQNFFFILELKIENTHLHILKKYTHKN